MTDIGTKFELLLAQLLSSKRVHRSGAGKWHKMDVRGRTLLWSCKATEQESGVVSIKKTDLDEVRRAARGPGGTGDIPAVAIRNGDELGVYMSLTDFAELLSSDVEFPVDRNEERRRLAKIPAALR